MFDGVPEQFHQFITSRTSLPLPLSFNLHGSNQTFSTFDPYPSHQTILQQPSFFQQLHHQSIPNKDDEREENSMLSTNLELERERPISEETIDRWSNDEVLALLRTRSSMENWFPDFTWEHVSRKLAELGFKKSAEKCKEKFEEETRQFNNIGYTKNYRLFNELELCHGETSQINLAEKKQDLENPIEEDQDNMGQILEEDLRFEKVELNPSQENEKLVRKLKSKKRKKKEKFGMLKSFCEEVVKKMIAQQEEWHNKLIQDMVRREKEKIEREEAWKKQEMETINKEIEKRAHEQAIAGTRQATIIEFLKKFTSNEEPIFVVPNTTSISLSFSPSQIQPKNPNSTSHEACNQENLEADTSSFNQNNTNVLTSFNETLELQNPSFQKVPLTSTLTLYSQNPNSTNTKNNPMETTQSSTQNPPENPNFVLNEREYVGKRWPRDEVLALINLRSSLYTNGEDKEGTLKGPLWERISQGMFDLGYKRSAKRCKEKWENINKYFRKTKDVNKKRSLESRTCPYFHQLSSLYNQGKIVAPVDGPENHPALPENQLALPDNHLGSSHVGSSSDVNFHAADGDKSVTQVPGFNFEF